MIDHLAEFRVEQDEKPWEQITLPTEAQLKRFADVVAKAGVKGEQFDVLTVMKLILLASLNKDFILGYDRQ